MKHNENDELDHSLKELNKSLKWNNERQQKVRNNLTSAVNQDAIGKTGNITDRLKPLLLPVTSSVMVVVLVTIILMSEMSTPLPQSSNNIIETDNIFDQQTSIIISEDQNEQIKEMEEEGFVLAIPEYVPKTNTELQTMIHRQNENHTYVFAQFYSEGNELFSLHQEAIHAERQADRSQVKQSIENRYSEQLEIRGITAYFRENEAQKQLFLMTDNYSLEISSHDLSKDELIMIVESIRFESLTLESNH